MDKNSVQELLGQHNISDTVVKVQPETGGYSHDTKYILWVDGNPRYLLRLSDIDQLERRRGDFDLIGIHHRRGSACPETFAFGETPDKSQCYMLLEYLIGESADKVLAALDETRQYEIGVRAGQELFKLHQVPATETHEDWLTRRIKKYRRHLDAARRKGFGFAGQETVERFIEDNLGVLKASPVRFQHDDFHPANLILDAGRFVGVIDFNRCDWGDPIEDFIKVPMFAVPVSQPFARGQIEGYLASGEVPEFWLRYNLFLAMNLHASLVWESLNSTPQRQAVWAKQLAEIVRTHDFETSAPPEWFNG